MSELFMSVTVALLVFIVGLLVSISWGIMTINITLDGILDEMRKRKL
jgi:hypothetical protein